MSIASEITRLQNAKSNLKNKLETKGVSVGNERLDEMVELVDNIQGGSGTDTTDATATASDITLGATAYVKGEKVIGTNELSRLQAEGGISYNGGLYVNETLQGLIELNAPNKINVMVPNVEVRVEYGGKVKSPNLEPQNIAKDVNILGVVGTFEGGGGSTSQEDGFVSGLISGDYTNDRVTIVRKYGFAYCNLTSISLPNVTILNDYAIAFNPTITSIYLPLVTFLPVGAFYNNETLLTIKLPLVNQISQNTFRLSKCLTDIYLGYNGVVILDNENAFLDTLIGVKIHVRPEYADQYATATNWSSLINNRKLVIVGDYSD